MNRIPKINNDAETTRMQRNMTETQKRTSNQVKEGKIVNSFVKDPNVSLDETFDYLVISHNEVDMPPKVFDIEKKDESKGLKYLAATSVAVMSAIGSFTGLVKNFSKKKLDSTQEYLLPGITRNHCINDELHQSIFSMIQSPNRKTVLASVGVITLSAMVFLAKTFIDGFRDVWVKKQEADIQKNLQENLIAVETQSFSGKIQIIRSMLASKAKMFSNEIETNDKLTFTAKKEEEKTQKDKSALPLLALGGVTLLGILTLGYYSMKNLRKSEEFIKQGLDNTKQGLDNIIKEFNQGKPLGRVEGHNGEVLSGKDAYKQIIENMLESIYAKPEEIEEYISKMNLEPKEKEAYIKQLKTSMNQATEKVNSAIGGSGRNKITYFSHVNEYLSFYYDWLMNPKNPQFKNLFFGIAGISGAAYLGTTATNAIKDVQVKKYSADVELDLQKRLVATELRNFKAKKESAIEPLCDEFFKQKQNGKKPEELKILADNILFEIKNGPPFVYS
ncbi:MAG: hypothetical protein E7Z89_01030 [Cyanobacteria bacterium SIG28]|nr:hypothetical protein [Cyanobacteria bacterium SIG28]